MFLPSVPTRYYYTVKKWKTNKYRWWSIYNLLVIIQRPWEHHIQVEYNISSKCALHSMNVLWKNAAYSEHYGKISMDNWQKRGFVQIVIMILIQTEVKFQNMTFEIESIICLHYATLLLCIGTFSIWYIFQCTCIA